MEYSCYTEHRKQKLPPVEDPVEGWEEQTQQTTRNSLVLQESRTLTLLYFTHTSKDTFQGSIILTLDISQNKR